MVSDKPRKLDAVPSCLYSQQSLVAAPFGAASRIARLTLLEGLAPRLQFYGLFHHQMGGSRFG